MTDLGYASFLTVLRIWNFIANRKMDSIFSIIENYCLALFALSVQSIELPRC